MTAINHKRDFSRGKIYKIEPICEYEEGDIYIGSTTQDLLCKRMRDHRDLYKCWKNGKHHKYTSYVLFDKYGVDNCKIVLIENVNASNHDELLSREAYYIRAFSCVNKKIPLRTQTEYYKDYYEDNKESINRKQRESYELKKESHNERHKKYYKLNKEAISEKAKQRYQRKKQETLQNLNNTEIVNI